MFEDVEQEKQRVLFAGLKGIVERTDVNFGEMRIGGIDDVAVGFDAFDVAEFSKGVKEERVAAAYIEDGVPAFGGLCVTKDLQDPACAHLKPPVIFVEATVVCAVGGVHARKIP